MALQTQSAGGASAAPPYKITRKRGLAIALILLGLYILWQASANLGFDVITTLTLQPGSLADVPHLVVPTRSFLTITSLFFIVTGVLALLPAASLARYSTGMMVVAGLMLVPSILIAAAAGDSTNVTTMFVETLRLATPIGIGAMAGIWSERVGVVNIAIEGTMLFGACFGFTTLFFLRNAFPPDQIYYAMVIAVLVAIAVGGLVALLHGWLSITFATDQIVSGTVINILAVGATSFVRREYLLSTEAGVVTTPNLPIPFLSDIPILGDTLFNGKPIFYLMFVVIILTHVMLFYTRWGLRVRAVGEQPSAADTLGIKVNRTRWINVFISGMIAGLAGAWFSLEATGRFDDGMTRGAGFIALAAMIFGKWTPAGAFGGALLFGFADSLGTRFQIIDVAVPVQFLQMVPYLVTLIVLAGLVGRAIPPKAIGVPYKKE